jgi:hypothetical protein
MGMVGGGRGGTVFTAAGEARRALWAVPARVCTQDGFHWAAPHSLLAGGRSRDSVGARQAAVPVRVR